MLQRFFERWRGRTLSPYQEVIQKYQNLTEPDTSIYRSIKRVDVLFETMDVYTDIMENLIQCLENNLGHPTLPKYLEVRTIRLSQFYLTKDGDYANTALTLRTFASTAADLLDLYERKMSDENSTGITQHVLHRARPVINNLITISDQLAP